MQYLGKQSDVPSDPDAFKLDCVGNAFADNLFCARFTCPEFTSLCPKTGQPDFATIVIDYVPDTLLVESKALKLYLTAFRNVGDFHETVTNKITDKIMDAAEPRLLRVAAFFFPRGGIPIDVMVIRGDMKLSRYMLDLDQRLYRGR